MSWFVVIRRNSAKASVYHFCRQLPQDSFSTKSSVTETIHASSLAKERTVLSTEALSETGSMSIKAWYTAMAELCQTKPAFLEEEKNEMRWTLFHYLGCELERKDEKSRAV